MFKICILSHLILSGSSEGININLYKKKRKGGREEGTRERGKEREARKHIGFASVISSLFSNIFYTQDWVWYVSDQAVSNLLCLN